jgi:glycosyltransferase involved in cell wall biosynthesis
MIKVTVIIPSYNHAKFIGEAIQSVLNQTFKDFEILICDDASKDNSVDIIKQFTDPRIIFNVNSQNIGAVDTTNNMIQKAKGEYIALLNSDDVWCPEKLEKQVKFLDENHQYQVVFSNALVIGEDGLEYREVTHFYSTIFKQVNRSRAQWLSYFFNVGNCICHPSMLIRKNIYTDIGLYNRLMASVPDFEMWIRICTKYDIYVMPEKLIKFRILDNDCNASGNNPENIIRGQFEIQKIFEAFCSISDIEIFNSAFPDHTIQSVKQIPIQLAKILLNDLRANAKYWAINKIYQLLESDYNYYSKYITNVEFTKLTAQNDIFDVLHFRNVVTQVYYTVSENFNDEECLQQVVKPGINRYEFKISNISGIKKIRVDPANVPAHVQFIKAFIIDEGGLEYPLIIKVNNATQINQNKFSYFHSDPSWIFDEEVLFEVARLDKIIIEFGVEVIDASELATYASISLKEYSNSLNLSLYKQLNDNQNILFTIKKTLIFTQNELQLSKDELMYIQQKLEMNKLELDKIYCSYSWRVTRPFRQCSKIIRKLKNKINLRFKFNIAKI